MKALAVVGLFWCFTIQAFTVLPGVATLPPVVHYRCDDNLKETFIADFEQWNSVLSWRFTLEEVSDFLEIEPDITVIQTDNILPDMGWFNGARTIAIAKTLPYGEDVRTVLLHEIGHRLGLGHSTNVYAIMYPSVYPFEQPVLAGDDIDGARWLYSESAVDLSSLMIAVKGAGRARTFTTGGYTVNWDFGDGLNGFGQQVKHRFSAPGLYRVTATYLGVSRSVDVQIGHPRRHKEEIRWPSRGR